MADDELKKRLIAATCRRRQILEYSKRHQMKLERGLTLDGDSESEHDSEISDTNPSFMPGEEPTRNSTEVEVGCLDLDRMDVQSNSSYASSIAGSSSDRLTIPAPPEGIALGGDAFTCPYCLLPIAPPNMGAWGCVEAGLYCTRD